MPANYDPEWNIEELTDTEIYAAIRYLEPDPRNANQQDTHDHNKDNGAVFCVCLYVALLSCLGFFWFYWR